MIKMHEIREIIRLLDHSSIQEFELEDEGTKITIKKGITNTVSAVVHPNTQVVQAPVVEQPKAEVAVAPIFQAPKEEPTPVQQPAQVSVRPVEQNFHKIVSPMVGTFYSKPEPGASSFVNVGDKVTSSTIVCIVEAMKLFNEIEAEVNGEIVEVLVTDGQLVEYGQPLYLVKA